MTLNHSEQFYEIVQLVQLEFFWTFTKYYKRWTCQPESQYNDTILALIFNLQKYKDKEVLTISKQLQKSISGGAHDCGLQGSNSENFAKIWKHLLQCQLYTEAHSEPCQTSKMELFAKIVNSSKLLNISKKFHLRSLTEF